MNNYKFDYDWYKYCENRKIMKNYELDYDWHEYCENKKIMIGNSVDISTKNIRESEIKADIIVEESKSIRLWGQVKDCKIALCRM